MNSLERQRCPVCKKGMFARTTIEYEVELPDDQTLVVPKLFVERCDRCGETVFPVESSHRIESAIAEHTGQLTPHDVPITPIR